MKDAHSDGMELTDRSGLIAMKKMTGMVERFTRDERQLDNQMKAQLKMKARKRIMDTVKCI